MTNAYKDYSRGVV
ncbi:hypothetical protein Q9966_004990 [Columba livia]|nr:hypothetical protein Q9966_004990 [Columba livia]